MHSASRIRAVCLIIIAVVASGGPGVSGAQSASVDIPTGAPVLPPIGGPSPPKGNTPTAPVLPTEPNVGAVGPRIDAQHTGYLDDPRLVAPLELRWSRALDGSGSPVYADGRIFAAASNGVVQAFDALSGRPLWKQLARSTELLFDSGRVLASNDTTVRALDPRTGRIVWTQGFAASDSRGAGHAVAGGGIVYFVAAGRVAAIRVADGAMLWSRLTQETDPEPPVIDDQRLYVPFACHRANAYSRASGEEVRSQFTDCEGLSAHSVAAVHDGLVYMPDTSAALDPKTGHGRDGRLPGSPTFGGSTGVFAAKGGLTAVNPPALRVRWRIRDSIRDATSAGLPIGVYHSLYRAESDGNITGYRLTDGGVVWKARVPKGPLEAETLGFLSAAPGLLLVTTPSRIVAYQSVYRPAPRGVAWNATTSDVAYRSPFGVQGVIGAALRGPGARVRIDYDGYPYGGWSQVTVRRVEPDGFFAATIRQSVNTRYRIVAGGARSRSLTVYAFPRLHVAFHRAGANAIRLVFGLTTARDVRLAGRRAFVYLGRVRARRFDRLGSTRLQARGSGRTAGLVKFPAIRSVGSRDFVTVCVPRQYRLGLGRRDRLARSCGRARVRA